MIATSKTASVSIKVSLVNRDQGNCILARIIATLAPIIEKTNPLQNWAPSGYGLRTTIIHFVNNNAMNVKIFKSDSELILQFLPNYNNRQIALEPKKIGACDDEATDLIVQFLLSVLFKRMASYGIEDIPEGLDYEGAIQDETTLKEAFQKFEEEQAIAAYVALTGDDSASRESILQELAMIDLNELD